jgi:hypothetical protein
MPKKFEKKTLMNPKENRKDCSKRNNKSIEEEGTIKTQ